MKNIWSRTKIQNHQAYPSAGRWLPNLVCRYGWSQEQRYSKTQIVWLEMTRSFKPIIPHTDISRHLVGRLNQEFMARCPMGWNRDSWNTLQGALKTSMGDFGEFWNLKPSKLNWQKPWWINIVVYSIWCLMVLVLQLNFNIWSRFWTEHPTISICSYCHQIAWIHLGCSHPYSWSFLGELDLEGGTSSQTYTRGILGALQRPCKLHCLQRTPASHIPQARVTGATLQHHDGSTTMWQCTKHIL